MNAHRIEKIINRNDLQTPPTLGLSNGNDSSTLGSGELELGYCEGVTVRAIVLAP